MSANNRRNDPTHLSPEAVTVLTFVGTVITVMLVAGFGAKLGHTVNGTADTLPSDPFALVLGVFKGTVSWPLTSTVFAVIVAVVIVAAALLLWAYFRGSQKKRTRVDSAARYMGTGKDIEALTEKSALLTAERLGVHGHAGVPIGNHLVSNKRLYASWEDTHADIWGPRTGKTSCRAIPAIIEAPGAVIVTSNKRDVVDATRDVRLKNGAVWVFDPQAIALEEPSWYWNPLSYVTDEVRAAKLADHFASGSREPGAKTDAYFDPAGQDLLAGMLLAAALDQRPITDVYRWLTRPTEDAPVRVLTEHGFTLMADQVAGVIDAPEKQRGGIYGTAQQMASCLTNRQIVKWVTRVPKDTRPEFSPERFVREGGTLYSLSKEGKGTAGPLVTGLTVAVVEAAEELAAHSTGGRLAVPLVAVLDEAANVCRWRALPDLYSHYGSRGIVIMTILQSWSQGCEVWTEAGMRKLWSAANVRCYGGGVSETAFLEDLSRLIGEHDRMRTSVSSGRDHRSVSQQVQRERTLDVSDLGAMPKGRAVIVASGSRPTMIRTVPWMKAAYADEVRASIAAHDPQSEKTIADAEAEIIATDQAQEVVGRA